MVIINKKTTGYRYTDLETMNLQIRKILELIALGNLVSNKEEYSKQYKNFENHYHAKHIFRDLEKVNPNFYPIPTRQILDEKKEKVIRTEPILDGYLTKDEFIELYDESANFLHAQNPFKPEKELKNEFAYIGKKTNRIKKLLDHHQIQLADENYQIWALMNSKKDGRAYVFIFRKVKPPKEGI